MMEPKLINAHAFPRAADEWYVEPPAATEILLTRERFSGLTLDPCCGQGNVVTTLRAHGVDAIGTDIVDRTRGASWFKGTADFLAHPIPSEVQNLCFNPPYSGGAGVMDFVRHAHSAPWLHKIAVFVECRFLFGDDRAMGFHENYPPQSVVIVSPRQSCPPGDFLRRGGKAEGGKADHVWMVYKPALAGSGTKLLWRGNL